MKNINAWFGCILLALFASLTIQASVITDTFDDGDVLTINSMNFWSSTGGALETNDALLIKAEYLGSPETKNPKSTLLSSSLSEADFLSGPVSLKLEGLRFAKSTSDATYKAQFRAGFTAHSTTTSIHSFEDVFAFQFRQDGKLRLGYSLDNTNEDPELTNTQLDMTLLDPMGVDTIELQLDGSGSQLSWAILVTWTNNASDSFSGTLSVSNTTAFKSSWNAGEYRVAVEEQFGTAIESINGGAFASTVIDTLTISTLSGVTSPTSSVVDNFDNGNVSSTDTISNFWSPLGGVTETNGTLLLKAEYEGGTLYPRCDILSSSITNADFLSGSVSLKMEGLVFSRTDGEASYKGQLRAGFTSHTSVTSMRSYEDVIAFQFRQDGKLRLGYSLDGVSEDPETANNQLDVTLPNPTDVDTIEFMLDASGSELSWEFLIDWSTGGSTNLAGTLSETDTTALKNSWNTGQYHVAMEEQYGPAVASTNWGAYASISIDKLTVQGGEEIIPPTPFSLSVSSGNGFMLVSSDNLPVGYTHMLQVKTNLLDAVWMDVSPTSGVTSATWTIPTTNHAAFYQVKLQ